MNELYGGTKNEMARLINESGVLGDTVVTVSTMMEQGNFDTVVSYDTIIEAIHKVQSEMGITGTTAKEAASTISGSVASMKAAWGNMLTGIANENADFSGLVGNLVSSVETALANLLPRIQTALGGIAELIAGIAPMVIGALPGLFAEVLPGLTEGITAMLTSVTESLPGLVDAVIAQLPTMLTALQTVGDSLLASVRQIAEKLVTAFSDAFNGLTGIDISPLVESLSQVVTLIRDTLGGMLEGIDLSGVAEVVNGFLTTIAGAISSVVAAVQGDTFQNFVSALMGMLTTIGGSLVSALQPAADGIRALFTALAEGSPGVITAVATAFEQFAKWFESSSLPDIIGAVASGLVTLFTAFLSEGIAVIGTVATAIGQLFANFTSDKADSGTKLADAVVKLLGVFVSGIEGIITAIADSITYFATQLAANEGTVSGFAGVIQTLADWFGDLLERLTPIVDKLLEFIETLLSVESTASDVFGSLGEIIGAQIGAVVSALTDFYNQVKGWIDKIKAAFEGLSWEGIVGFMNVEEEIANINDAINSFGEGIVTGVKDSLGWVTGEEVDAARRDISTQQSTSAKITEGAVNAAIQSAQSGSSKNVDITLNVSGRDLWQATYDEYGDVLTQKGG